MIRTTITLEVETPAERVYSYLSDFTNNPAWQSGVQSTEWTSAPPLRVGSSYVQTMEYKGIATSYTITAIDPGFSITSESEIGATIPTTVTRTVRSLNESRCQITVDLIGRPHGLRRFSKPLLARVVRKSVAADYRRLKRLLESVSEQP